MINARILCLGLVYLGAIVGAVLTYEGNWEYGLYSWTGGVFAVLLPIAILDHYRRTK